MKENDTNKKSINTRELIVEMLLEITTRQEYSHLVIRNVLDKYNYLDNQDKSFMKRVLEGTLERMIQIDYIINQFSNVKVNKMKPAIRTIIRMSVYQILFMDSVPDSAACNEAVKLAEKKHFFQLKGFVNGVLRNIARQKEEIKYPSKKTQKVLYYSVTYSMPEWIVEKWLLAYHEDVVEQILSGLLEEHKMTIRMDEMLSKEQKSILLQKMEEKGILVKQHPYLSYAYEIEQVEGVTSIPGFMEGMLTIQDISSMLIAEIADIAQNNLIIDVCAAPGGKSLHAATKLKGTGHVDARDLNEYKTAMIQENIDRFGYKNITTRIVDALEVRQNENESADILLADLPCSGLGVIGKKRDIKYKVTEESLQSVVKLQKEILSNVSSYVKQNGVMIYSTCTINQEENEKMVQWITKHLPFQLESIDPYLPEVLKSETTNKGYLQLLPGIHAADGFFMARFRKV